MGLTLLVRKGESIDIGPDIKLVFHKRSEGHGGGTEVTITAPREVQIKRHSRTDTKLQFDPVKKIVRAINRFTRASGGTAPTKAYLTRSMETELQQLSEQSVREMPQLFGNLELIWGARKFKLE